MTTQIKIKPKKHKTSKYRTTIEAMEGLVAAVRHFGWSVAVPNSSNDKVDGLVIGKSTYVNSVMAALKKAGWKLPKSRRTKR